MTLPASGPISIGDINTELGRASNTANTSLNDAEDGVYATINTASPSRPSSTNPASMSEWYSYNHAASATYTATLYGRLAATATSETGWYIEYQINGGGWTTTSLLGTGLTTCAQRTVISGLVNGDTVELRCTDNNNADICHNWAAGTTCPTANCTYGASYYSFTQSAMSTSHACNVEVSVGQFNNI
jgi:hypothetical protein